LLVLGEDRGARSAAWAPPTRPRRRSCTPTSRSPSSPRAIAARARAGLRQALIAGGDVRNPRLVALERLIAEAERAAAAAAAAAAAGVVVAPAADAP
jgi:hypothetical protein